MKCFLEVLNHAYLVTEAKGL